MVPSMPSIRVLRVFPRPPAREAKAGGSSKHTDGSNGSEGCKRAVAQSLGFGALPSCPLA